MTNKQTQTPNDKSTVNTTVNTAAAPMATQADAKANKANKANTIDASQLTPELAVVCTTGGQVGVVDHMVGADTIKLKKDANGVHHYIPLAWIASVDGKAHLDRPGAQAMKEWSDKAPTAKPPAARA